MSNCQGNQLACWFFLSKQYVGLVLSLAHAYGLISFTQVGRALGFFKTGNFEIDNSPVNHFSADNFGDRVLRIEVPGARGKYKKVKDKRATSFVPSIESFDEERWATLLDEAKHYLPKKKGRAVPQSTSRASSDGIELAAEEEDIVILSDDWWIFLAPFI